MAVITAFLTALLLFLSSGMHIAVALGLTATCLLFIFGGMPLSIIAQKAFGSVNSYALAAIPFFILAGEVIMEAKLADRLLDFAGLFLRRVRGGLAMAVVITSVFFAAVSGSSVASVAALGRGMVEMLKHEDYPKRFIAGLVAAGGTLGLLIPPSLTFILIGSMQGLPILDLFTAGIIPGLLEAFLLMSVCLYMCIKNGWGKVVAPVKADRAEVKPILKASSGILFMPFLILGGIYLGFFTPTEVAAVAVGYAFFLALVIYRTLPLQNVFPILSRSLLQSGMIYFVVIGGNLTGVMLITLGVTEKITTIIASAGVEPWHFLLMVNIVLLMLGAVLDGVSMIVLTVPVLFPVAQSLGINPYHFAVIMTVNVEIATLTPPVGLNLYVMSGVTGLSIEEVARGIGPFYIVQIVFLLLVTYVPFLSLMLI